MEYSRPAHPGAPPIWLEGREKYIRGPVSDFGGFDNIPVDLWFGKRDGNFDTTHLRIASDYFIGLPLWHGEHAPLNIVWPSMRSIDEEIEIRNKNGMSDTRLNIFRMTLSESDLSFSGTDRAGSRPVGKCSPMVSDTQRGVIYCNEPSNNPSEKRYIQYWPLDENIRTPFYKNPPRFKCYIVEEPEKKRFEHCFGYFSYNADFQILIDTHEELAIAMLNDFPRLIEFLHTLEVTP